MVINNNNPINQGLIKSIRNNQTENTQKNSQNTVRQEESFKSILDKKLKSNDGLVVSKHAKLRMDSRNINLSDSQMKKIEDAVKKADEKGVKDSLVIMDNMAFVVNVKSKTMITAANNNDLKENIFTNIDGAVFA
jgi:flagellar operon protein